MVSKFEQERDRRGKLSDYLYGVSKLFVSGVGIGGLSPLITGQEMGLNTMFVSSWVPWQLMGLPIVPTLY